MVSGVHYYATADDERALLAGLGYPDAVELRPWVSVIAARTTLSPEAAVTRSEVMIVNPALGEPVGVAGSEDGVDRGSVGYAFRESERERRGLPPESVLMDVDASPVLLWVPARLDGQVLRPGCIGSQAASAKRVSVEFEHWVKSVEGRIRRRGTRVWGLEQGSVRPDLAVHMDTLNSIYAMPGALKLLEAGAQGRGRWDVATS